MDSDMTNSTVPGNPCYAIGGADPALNCIPEPAFTKQVMYTTLAATVAWCIVVALSITAFRGIYSAKSVYSSRMKSTLLCYTVLMTLFSTGALVQNVVFVQNVLFSMFDFYSESNIIGALIYDSVAVTLPFAASGADGLMAWRCWVLYNGVNRRLRIAVSCLLVLLFLCSLTSAVLTIVLADANFAPATPLLAVTITINLILSGLIVSRLLYHERALKSVLGVKEKTSPLRRIMAMCVESCALIVIFAVISLGMEWSPSDLVWNLSLIPATLLPHICVISPFLIIIRVANGRAPSTTLLPSSVDSDSTDVEIKAGKHRSIRFNRPESTQMSVSPGIRFIVQ
ncbi:hypothetical protein BDN70DRAFT_995384 [Pholiota conissans]|uniref:Uncharacterized protein n=1 Tax=Pholiota conissans TaxID=109636 RepID=A0A9P6CYP7_9AGAR|nr:hypothetical protein BDN70DRAFT_995384 [Pholiota conissans]